METPLEHYSPLLLYFGIVIVAVLALMGSSLLLGPRRPTIAKSMPYESGTQTPGNARQRFSVHFYLVAMLFILFDVEAVFLFPWAVGASQLGLLGLLEVSVFVAILGLGLLYAWRKQALSWD